MLLGNPNAKRSRPLFPSREACRILSNPFITTFLRSQNPFYPTYGSLVLGKVAFLVMSCHFHITHHRISNRVIPFSNAVFELIGKSSYVWHHTPRAGRGPSRALEIAHFCVLALTARSHWIIENCGERDMPRMKMASMVHLTLRAGRGRLLRHRSLDLTRLDSRTLQFDVSLDTLQGDMMECRSNFYPPARLRP